MRREPAARYFFAHASSALQTAESFASRQSAGISTFRLASTRRGGLEDGSKRQTESVPRGIFTGIRPHPTIKFLSFAQHQRLATCMLGRLRLEPSSASVCSGRTYLVGAVGPGRAVQHHLHGRAFGRPWSQAIGVDIDDLDIDEDLVLLELRMTECTSSVPPLRTGDCAHQNECDLPS